MVNHDLAAIIDFSQPIRDASCVVLGMFAAKTFKMKKASQQKLSFFDHLVRSIDKKMENTNAWKNMGIYFNFYYVIIYPGLPHILPAWGSCSCTDESSEKRARASQEEPLQNLKRWDWTGQPDH